MAESQEYRTIVSCARQLKIFLGAVDRDIVLFLHQEGFITEEVYHEVLNPKSMLNNHQKAENLWTGIRNSVELSAQSFHTLMNHLRQGGKQYEHIVRILAEDYSRQEQG